MSFFKLPIKILILIDIIKKGDFWNELKNYFHCEVVPMEKQLLEIEFKPYAQIDAKDLNIIESDSEHCVEFVYPQKSSEYKIRNYLRRGYRGFLIVRDNYILGYMWYSDGTAGRLHPDLKLLDINPESKSAYIFDLFISEEIREANFSYRFLNNSLYNLKLKGYEKVYGYYSNGNVKSLWLHRALGFRENDHILWKRILFKRRLVRLRRKSQ